MKKLYPFNQALKLSTIERDPGKKTRLSFFKFLTALAAFVLSPNQNCKAQIIAYTFSQSSSVYTPVANETVLAAATDNTATLNLNSVVSAVNIPFAFSFNGTSYTSLNVSSNGFITFGSVAPSPFYTSPISGTTSYQGAISAWGRDISSFYNIGGKTGKISYGVTGNAPNREFIIQWTNFRPNASTVSTIVYSFSFQIRLKETSNIIQMAYDQGSYLAGSTTVNGTAEIGIRGASNAEFNNRLNPTTAVFSASGAGTAGNSAQAFNTVGTVPGMPPADLVYTWTPPSCYTPTGISVNNLTSVSAILSWNASASLPGGYDIYYSTSSAAPTSSTAPTVSNVPGTSYQINNLNPLTTYYAWVRSNCGSGNVSVWSLDPMIFTTKCSNPPAAPTVNGATIYPNHQAILTANPSSSANYSWYDAPNGGNLMYTGNPFTTPALTATTNYYVSTFTGTSGIPTGRPIYTNGGAFTGFGTTNFGLVFDVLSYMVLESITVYPLSTTSSQGTLTIDVIDSNGVIVNTKTVSVTGAPVSAPVAQVINLDFPIFPGTNYKLRPRGYTGIDGLLYESNTTAGYFGYPLNVQNLVDIKYSTLTAAPANTPNTGLYYYFYDWKVGNKCESARSPVTVTVDSTLSTSEADTKNTVKIYPNPFSDAITIDRPELIGSLGIFDASGKLVMRNVKAEQKLILSHLVPGAYIVQILMKDGTRQSVKLIKK